MRLTEQRRNFRVTHPFLLWFRPEVTGTEPWQAAPLRDVSSRGARFLSERAFATGTILEAKLQLPVSPRLIPLTVRVAWSRPRGRTRWSLIEHGVTFDPADETARRHILEAMERVVGEQAASTS